MPKKGRPKKRVQFFEEGHPCYKKRTPSDQPVLELQSQRLPASTFQDAVQTSSDGNHFTVTDSDGNPGNMRFFRPVQEDTYEDQQNLENDKTDLDGYKILHCGKLMDMINDFYSEHSINSPKCRPILRFNPEDCSKWGFCWRIGLKCDNCNFSTEKRKLYTESERNTPRGQRYATVNLGFQVGLQSNSIGIDGLRTLMLSAGIPVPSCSGMHKAGIFTSDTTTELNESDMQKRREKLTELHKIRGFDASHPTSVSGDGRYNNRLDSSVGHKLGQAGTQSVYCISENETKSNDIISVNIDNKICVTGTRLNAKCPDHPGTCTANIDKDAVIGDEGRSAERCALKMANDPVPVIVGQFTSDGDSAASTGFERGQKTHSNIPVENLRDSRHFGESQRKVVKNIKFSKMMFPGRNKATRDKVQQRFSIEVTKRCNAEKNLAHKQYAGDINKIIRKLSYTVDSVVQCLTGDCGKSCKKHSFVCSGMKKTGWKPKFLETGTILNPSDNDYRLLRDCIILRLGANANRKTRLNTNTQKNESMNRTFTKTNPKSVNYCRTLSGRIHGAVHMRNNGRSNSIRERLKAVGSGVESSNLVLRQLKNIQSKDMYHKARKNSTKYKERQSYLRRVRFNKSTVVPKNTGTYRKNILDPEMTDHTSLYAKKNKRYRMKVE